MRVSHETIYQSLYVQGRGALRRELTACLRTGRALREPRARTARSGRTFVTDDVKISQRPAEAADRAVPGALGRRPDHRPGQVRDRHPGRAPAATRCCCCPAWTTSGRHQRSRTAPAGRARRRGGQLGDRRPDRGAAGSVAQVIDLGPGRRTGQARPTQGSMAVSRSTSATRTHPGNAPATRTPTSCCASTSPRELTCPAGPPGNSTP